MVAITEGFVPFRGMRTWYRIAGDLDSGKVPLLLLHGGPGTGSDAFEPLEALACNGRAVVRYDQIGCGYSDRPRDQGLWTAGTFVDELTGSRWVVFENSAHLALIEETDRYLAVLEEFLDTVDTANVADAPPSGH